MKKYLLPALLLLSAISCKKEDSENAANVVINELMPVNSYTAMDEYLEFDDWVELYNNTSDKIDLSGYYLTDSKKNLSKWQIPSGTFINGKSFLIIWTDGDSLQTGLHTNFKLSSSGEKVLLVTPEKKILDEVEYGENNEEKSYSRVPNGTGDFQWKLATWNSKN